MGKGIPCGSGSQTAGKPSSGGACPGARSVTQTLGAGGRRAEPGLAGGTAQQVLQFWGSVCVQANSCQSNHGLVGVFGPLSFGIQELLRTSHFGDASCSPCSLLPALQGLISGFLVARACCASTKCLCPTFPCCPPGSKGAFPWSEGSSSVSIGRKLTMGTFYLC